MKASRQKHITKKRQRKTIVVKPDIPDDQVVDVGKEEDINLTDSAEVKGKVSQGLTEVRESKTQKKVVTKGKGSEPVSTEGLGSQVKRRKTEKILTKD